MFQYAEEGGGYVVTCSGHLLVIIRISVRPTLQVLGFGRTVGVRQVSTVVGVVLSTAH